MGGKPLRADEARAITDISALVPEDYPMGFFKLSQNLRAKYFI